MTETDSVSEMCLVLKTVDSVQSNTHVYCYRPSSETFRLSLTFECYEEETSISCPAMSQQVNVTLSDYVKSKIIYLKNMSAPVWRPYHASSYLRIEDFQEIIKQLFSNHDDRQLYAQF